MTVPSAVRILKLIEWLASQSSPVSLTKTSQAFSFPKSSTLLLLKALVSEGYVRRDREGQYQLIYLPGELSKDNQAWGTLLRISEPYLHQAVAEGKETGFIAVLTDEFRIRYLNKILPDLEIRYDRDISKDRIAHDCASGLAILSALPDEEFDSYLAQINRNTAIPFNIKNISANIQKTKLEGIGISIRGPVDGASGVAVPIFDAHGRAIAAINLSGPTDRVVSKIEIISEAAKNAARKLTEELIRRTWTASNLGKK